MQCALCAGRWREYKDTPLCRTAKGCHVKPLLKNKEVVSIVDSFQKKKILENKKGYDTLINNLIIEGGLNDLSLVLKLESVFDNWCAFKRKQNAG